MVAFKFEVCVGIKLNFRLIFSCLDSESEEKGSLEELLVRVGWLGGLIIMFFISLLEEGEVRS